MHVANLPPHYYCCCYRGTYTDFSEGEREEEDLQQRWLDTSNSCIIYIWAENELCKLIVKNKKEQQIQ